MNTGATCGRLIIGIVTIHLALFAGALRWRPKMDSDASSGMLVWRSMEKGAGWNSSFEPDPANIAHDRQQFLAWWSPGQYLAVGPLERLGLSLGGAIVTATLLCSLAGLFGYWRLYVSLGFTEVTAAWTAAVLSVVWHVTRNYGEFVGGELPLFAVSPWLLRIIFRMRPLSLTRLLPFAVVYLAGAMTKLSFCVTAASALAGVCCAEFLAAPSGRRLFLVGAKAAAMLLAAHLVLWIVFLRHGANPAGITVRGQPWWYVVPSVVVLPAGSVLGLGSLLARLFLYPAHAVFQSQASLAPILWALAIAFAASYWVVARRTALPNNYAILVAGMASVFVLILGSLITAGAPISLEDRQFFPLGALLLPGFVEFARSGSHRGLRWFARAGLALAGAYGLVAAFAHARHASVTANVGLAGITQHIISREAMSVLHALDDSDPESASGALIYVPSPEISFEVQHARVLSTYDLSLSSAELGRRTRRGRVPLLVVLSNPVLAAGGGDEIVRRSFVDYSPSQWKRREVGDWTFFYQGEWPLKERGAAD